MILSSLLLALVACVDPCANCNSGTGGNDIDDDCAGCPDDTDGDTATDEKGYLLVEAYIESTKVTAPVVIDGDVVGNTGESIKLDPGDYEVTIGDPTNMSTVDVPVYTATTLGDGWENSTWIAAAVTVTILPGDTVTMKDDDALTLYYYAIGANPTWTCQEDGESASPGDLTYSSTSLFHVPSVQEMTFTTSTRFVDVQFDGEIYSGEFPTSSTATIIADEDGTEYDSSYFCWAGDEDEDPRE